MTQPKLGFPLVAFIFVTCNAFCCCAFPVRLSERLPALNSAQAAPVEKAPDRERGWRD